MLRFVVLGDKAAENDVFVGDDVAVGFADIVAKHGECADVLPASLLVIGGRCFLGVACRVPIFEGECVDNMEGVVVAEGCSIYSEELKQTVRPFHR
jgi:hypothetical protein